MENERRFWRRIRRASIGVVVATLVFGAASIFWNTEDLSVQDPPRRESAGRDSPSAPIFSANARSEAASLEALRIGTAALESELSSIWQATADLGLRVSQDSFAATSLLRQDVWELGKNLQRLEMELGSPPISTSTSETTPK
jgi:hypothetical protein